MGGQGQVAHSQTIVVKRMQGHGLPGLRTVRGLGQIQRSHGQMPFGATHHFFAGLCGGNEARLAHRADGEVLDALCPRNQGTITGVGTRVMHRHRLQGMGTNGAIAVDKHLELVLTVEVRLQGAMWRLFDQGGRG
ncbi:hypothetical protein B9Z48_07180 [Limnohabitans sp. WS1]|nr:hypothetical protein B9Z48_07180 [Limnohabitans sp. WS1]